MTGGVVNGPGVDPGVNILTYHALLRSLVHVDFQELRETGFTVEQAILTQMLLFFGPLLEGLLGQVDDESWEGLLTALSQLVEEGRVPEKRFENWEEEDFPNLDVEAKRVLFRMLNLDPAKRADTVKISKDDWWKQDLN